MPDLFQVCLGGRDVLAGVTALGPADEGGIMKILSCPNGHGSMELKTAKKEMIFKGVDIVVEADVYLCSECGLEAGTPQSAGALQLSIADAYRARQGFLNSREDQDRKLQYP